MRWHRVAGAVVAVGGLMAACSSTPRDLKWRLDYEDPALRRSTATVELEVLRGGCDATGSADAAVGDDAVVYGDELSVDDGVPRMAPPTLEPGTYGFRAEARDEACSVLARGCTTETLPLQDDGEVVTSLLAVSGEVACPTDTCEGGRCDIDMGECSTASDCDDGVACTSDDCVDSRCTHSPDDSACDGTSVCDPVRGCIGGCVEGETCVAMGCEAVACEGGRCVRTPGCEDDEFCCNGECCADDGNPCTTTECTPDGCGRVAINGVPCDDGVLCNGADECLGGGCVSHEGGDPCGGSLTCDAASDTCVGCVADDDCPDPIVGPWSDCEGFSSTCDEEGTRTRTVTSFTCVEGTCVEQPTTETGDCTRDTDGRGCNDGFFCNGTDQCAGGSCSDSSGDPCAGLAAGVCDEDAGMCVECLGDADCSGDTVCCSGSCQQCCAAEDCPSCSGDDCASCGAASCTRMCASGSCACACT